MLPEKLAICQLAVGSRVPEWAGGNQLFSWTQTADELSIVCEESRLPADALADIRIERDWIGLKLQGPFPFELTGVLSAFIQPLAEAAIPIFSLSTFNTDFVLIKREKLEAALAALQAAGHQKME